MNKKYSLAQFLILVFYMSYSSVVAQSNHRINHSPLFSFDEQIVNGTTGTPLGGFGCGGIKFNANTGTFAVITTPPADAFDFVNQAGAQLQLYTQREGNVEVRDVLKASTTNGRPNDDAIFPLHIVDFGVINGVQVSLTGISPLDSENYDNMHLPYVLYEITLTNTEDSEVTSSFAFKWSSENSPLLSLQGKGIYSDEWSVLAKSDNKKSQISTGEDKDEQFLKNGICSSSKTPANTSKVAVKTNLNAHETQKIRFVVAWYNRNDPELGYYMNLYQNPKEIAEHGLNVFSTLKNNAEKLVTAMRASNLPDWLKNQTLNVLVNIVTNSMYKKDGRVAFSEGQWTCFGTMDQMWHARQIVSNLIPFYAWQELDYWARTQMKNGQIHHDFNDMEASDRVNRYSLVGWDDTEHKDYRDILKWVDLNCGFIISVFETYRATADQKRFDFLWPNVKRAAQRIFDQIELFGSKEYPFTFQGSQNSYDAGGDPDPYNASLSAVAYKIMVLLAQEKGETALAKQYENAYQTVVKSFRDRYITGSDFKAGKHCEAVLTGQWLAYHLNLGEIWSAEDVDIVLNKLENYYYPYYMGLGYPRGTYDEWTPYIVTHYGGLLLNTGRLEQWHVLQKDAYMRQYLNRDRVFDHPLNILPVVEEPKWVSTNIKSKKQYISMPGLWRNYYDIVGFHRDYRTKELWIKPIPINYTCELTDAMFTSPEGYGYINYTERDEKTEIFVRTEKEIPVNTLYLRDNFEKNVSVTIDDKPYSFVRKGSGYAKELAIQYNGVITGKGVKITLEGKRNKKTAYEPLKPSADVSAPTAINKMSPFEQMKASEADKLIGTNVVLSYEGINYVTSIDNFDYIQFSNVDFGKNGATSMILRAAGIGENSEVEIVLDDTAGKVVGSCIVPKTETPETWASIECPLEKITGVHNIILRFYGSNSDNLMNINWIQFKQ